MSNDSRLRELERRALSGDEQDVKAYNLAYCRSHECSVKVIYSTGYNYEPSIQATRLTVVLEGGLSDLVLDISDTETRSVSFRERIRSIIMIFCRKSLAVCYRCGEPNDLTEEYFKTITGVLI